MALINRMSRLFTADLHAVLDRMEEPDVLLKHAVREMEEELAREEQRSRVLEHESGSLAERQKNAQALLAELGEQLDVCFASGNDALCRKVLAFGDELAQEFGLGRLPERRKPDARAGGGGQ